MADVALPLDLETASIACALEGNEDIVIVLPRAAHLAWMSSETALGRLRRRAPILAAYDALRDAGYRVRVLAPNGDELLSGG